MLLLSTSPGVHVEDCASSDIVNGSMQINSSAEKRKPAIHDRRQAFLSVIATGVLPWQQHKEAAGVEGVKFFIGVLVVVL